MSWKSDPRLKESYTPNNIDAESVGYLIADPMLGHDGFVSDLEAMDRANADDGAFMTQTRDKANWTATNIRIASLFAIASIQTDTDLADANVSGVLKNYGTIKEFVENSTDGGKKWELCMNLYNSDIPEKVADLMQQAQDAWGNKRQKLEMDALATLANRDIETGKRLEDKWYLRTVKASFVFYLLGYETMCLDRCVFTALPIHRFIDPAIKSTPATSVHNPYRKRTYGGESYHLHKHKSVNTEMNHDYWTDRMQYNPVEYTGVMRHIVRSIDEHTTHIFNAPIPQLIFNLGKNGEPTFHRNLMEQLETEE